LPPFLPPEYALEAITLPFSSIAASPNLTNTLGNSAKSLPLSYGAGILILPFVFTSPLLTVGETDSFFNTAFSKLFLNISAASLSN